MTHHRLIVVLLLGLVATACTGAPTTTLQPTARPTQLVYAEQRDGETTVWSANPAEPTDRRTLVQIRHAPEWGIRAALSPDGRRLAYTVMQSGARDPDRDATLMLADLTTRRTTRLLGELDLRTTPLWSADGERVLAQRIGGGSGELVSVGGDGRVAIVRTAGLGVRLAPAGALPGGEWLVARLAAGASDLLGVSEGGATRVIGRLSDGPVRSFALSPDARRLAYLRILDPASGRIYRATVLDLASGERDPVLPSVARGEDTGVGWLGTADLMVSVSAEDGSGALLTTREASLTVRPVGFDALVGASPDGRWIASRSFTSGTSRAPGVESLTLIASDGRRIAVPTDAGGSVIGWSPG